MTELRKAAEMALEALDAYSWEQVDAATKALRQALSNKFNPDWNQVEALQESLREHMAEIQRLRQALALEMFSEVNQEIEEALKQQEQEPVAWYYKDQHQVWQISFVEPIGFENKPLYTAPQKREWVGITKEDKKEILEMTQPDERGYVIAITEAKLKEKNA